MTTRERTAGAGILLLLSLLPGIARAEAPTAPRPVAERTVTHGPRWTRVSLFDNRVAVVSTREGDRVTVRRLTLLEPEYEAVMRVLEIAARERASGWRSDRDDDGDRGEILLYLGREHRPERIPYSPLAMPDLRTQQLLAALDDVERLVLEAPPRADEIRAWEPAEGDRVRLWDGETGTVVELLPEGFVMVRRDVTFIREVVPPDARERMVLEILERARP